MNTTRRALATLALVALTAAGCGGSSESPETRTAGAPASADKLSKRDKAVKFAECMRNNGVSDFPDPNAKGQFAYGVSDPAAFEQGVEACKDLQPPGSLSGKRDRGQQSAALRFAQCMRENGVKDFPDPANGEPLVDTTRIPSSNRPGGMDILNAAMAKCRKSLDAAAAAQ